MTLPITMVLLSAAGLAALAAVYPEPREIQALEGSFRLDEQVRVVVPEAASEQDLSLARFFAGEMSDRYDLALRITRASTLPVSGRVVLMGSIENPLVKQYCEQRRLAVTRSDPGAEGYLLEAGDKVALVAGSDDRGAFYGLQTLRQLVENSGGLRIRAVRVRDWPHKAFRGIKLYLPGRDNLPFFKRFLRDFMALYKFNKLIVEMNAAMRLERHPELNAGWKEMGSDLVYSRRDRSSGPHQEFQDSTHHDTSDGGILEKAEVAALVEWARRYHIEVVPELPALTHSYYLLTRHRELAEIQDAEWPDTYCPSNPRSYDLLFDVLDEHIDVLKPGIIHLGHDEWRMPWGVCPRCRGKDPRDLFAQDVNRIHSYLARKKVRMAIWGDHLLEAVRSPGLRKRTSPAGYQYEVPGALSPAQVKERIPKDILIFNWFWGGRYPQSGEANDIALSEWSFEQVYGNFTPAIQNYGRRSERSGVLGAAPSAWLATTEYNFGKDLVYDFVGSASRLWSVKWPEPAELTGIVQRMMPEIRRNLSGQTLPSDDGEVVAPLRLPALQSSSANVAGVDLASLGRGGANLGSKVFEIPESAGQVVSGEKGVPVGEDVSSLIFLHASAKPAGNEPGYRYIYNFPDTADLLGWYEVVYEDGLVTTIPVRYGENILEWSWGRSPEPSTYCYRADPLDCSKDKQRPVVFFAFEWTNPRFGKTVKEVRLKGSSGFKNTRGRVIPENAIILAAVSVTRKRSFPEPGKARPYEVDPAPR